MPHIQSEAAALLGARIREVRNRLGITLEDLGALSEVHWTSVGKIERGAVHPSVETLVKLATALDTDPGEFIAGFSADLYPHRKHRMTAATLIAQRNRELGEGN